MELISPAITTGAWIWTQYGRSLSDKTMHELSHRWKRFQWSDAAEKYRSKIKKLYGTMQIMGMAEPISLDQVFTDVYMLDKPTALRRFDIERLKQRVGDPREQPKTERINGLRLVVEKGNLYILGKPGAGKTTFLKYIALKAAEQTIDKVPIFITLKHWADSGQALLPFIAQRFDICNFPSASSFVQELLESGSAIMLFDGLDEVNQTTGQRDVQTAAIRSFVEKFDRVQCLITCRIAASDYSFEPFSYVEIADFAEWQIKRFVSNWFRKEGEQEEDTSSKFLSELAREENKGLWELAHTPLLLTLLCLAFNETLNFPPRRVVLYKEALDALLKRWDASRRISRDEVYRQLDLAHKENLLAQIGAETFENNQYFIAKTDLERLIINYTKNVPPHNTNQLADGEAILRAMEAQHGVFVERARHVYSFSHLSFQEYFAAKYIVDHADAGALARLVDQHCADVRWREVFLLVTSMLTDATKFLVRFRRSIDLLIKDDEDCQSLLVWVNKKSGADSVSSVKSKQAYLFLALYRDSGAYMYVISRSLANGVSGTRSPFFELDDGLAGALQRDTVFAPTIERLSNQASRLGLVDLSNDLRKAIPKDRTRSVRVFGRLRALMLRHRDLGHAWKIKEPKLGRLAKYLYASNLLYECLPIACMPIELKQEIEDSLYSPAPHSIRPLRDGKSGTTR